MPGSTPATSQLDWLSSTSAMIVLPWSKATRDLLKSFSWGIGALRQLFASDDGAISSPPAPYHLTAGGGWIRTSGTADDTRLLADLYAHNALRQSAPSGTRARLLIDKWIAKVAPLAPSRSRASRRKKGVRIRQLLVCAALGREWWA